jgi:hypothetical protein
MNRRSGDQFCVYVFDLLILPTLSCEQIESAAHGQLSLDGLTRELIRHPSATGLPCSRTPPPRAPRSLVPVALRFETRASDSPWVDTVWTCLSERVVEMTSVATVCWGLVFWEREGRAYAGISGPETRTGTAPVPEGATFLGIEFAVGTSLRAVPTPALVGGGAELPDATHRTFRLDGVRWEKPGPDDAEALVERLVGSGTVVRDPLVTQVRRGHRPAVSGRTVERRFRGATGLTQGAVRQIERARKAAALLAAAIPVADVVSRLEYFDEPHLARALRRYVGRTARRLREGTGGAIALDLDQPATS